MAKVRIKAKEWAGFSSHLGPTKFTDGVSDEDVSDLEALRLGSIMAIEVFEEDGSSKRGGYGQLNIDLRGNKPPVEPKKIMGSEQFNTPDEIKTPDVVVSAEKTEVKEEENLEAELEAAVSENDPDTVTETGEEEEVQEPVRYTKQDLEDIADEHGISGIRKISDPMDVKSNQIEVLIEKILKAQG